MSKKVQWPALAYAPAGDDLSSPIKQLLIDLRLLEDSHLKVTLKEGTPQGLQVMTAGATSISKWVTAAVALGGGSAAIATGIKGFLRTADPAQTDSPWVSVAFILGGSILGVAVVIALAMVVRADVSARANASAAQFDARGAVTAALLKSFVAPSPPPIEVPGYRIQLRDGSWCEVQEFVWQQNELFARIENDKVPTREWAGLVSV